MKQTKEKGSGSNYFKKIGIDHISYRLCEPRSQLGYDINKVSSISQLLNYSYFKSHLLSLLGRTNAKRFSFFLIKTTYHDF